MSDWNSELYLKFEKERTQPSVDLVKSIENISPERIIDIGCGPGNSTAQLKKRFENAYILGTDFSPDMIKRAKSDYPDLDFMLFDASRDFEKLVGKFDVVFSNACIQWVPNHKKLLADMMSILNPGGVMAVQIPVQERMPVHRIIAEVVLRDKWKSKINSKRRFFNLEEEEYFDLLSDISSDFRIWKTIYYHRLPSRESIVDWYSSTGLKPYLEQLNDEESIEFKNDILTELKEVYPCAKNGEVVFKFHRLFLYAVR